MIDFLIVAFYMISILGVGIISGLKVKDLQDYSISKVPFSPFVLMAAIFATLVGGGSTMGVSEKVFSTGLVFLLACAGFVLRDLIIAFFIVPKFDKFKGCLTVGDIMAIYYGKVGRISVGIAGTLQSSTYLSMQLAAIGHLLYYFLAIPYWFGIFIGVGIVVVYSSFGGIRSVTITDVIQFSVLIVAIPVTFTIGLDMVGGFYGVLNSVPKEKLSFIPSTDDEVRFYSLVFVFILPYMNPALVQRLLMGRTIAQVRGALIIAALGRLPYYAMVGILGLVAFILEPTLKADMAFPYLVNTVLPIGVKGFVISGLMAVIMSTADSYLHVAGLLLTHDVIKPIMGDRLSEKQEFKLARYVTLIIGSIALVAAMSNTNIIELNILAVVFWLPAIFVPLVSGILGVCGSIKAFLWSGILGIVTYLVWKYLIYELMLVDSLLPAVLVNAATFFTIVYFEKKSSSNWFFIGRLSGTIDKVRQIFSVGRFSPKSVLDIFRRVASQLVDLSAKRVEIFGAPYALFVLFAIANFCFVPIIFSNISGQVTPVFIIYLRVFASGLSFVLVMKDFWPKAYLRYLPIYWHITLFVCLPFFAISMCLFSSCSIEWVIDLVLTNFILGLLVDWKTYIATILFGGVFATGSFFLFGDLRQFDPNLGNFPIMAYATIVSLLAGAIFSRNKERVLMEKLVTFKALGGTIAHEMRTPLSSIQISASGLKECLPALVEGYQQARLAGIRVPKISQLTLESIASAPERMRYICASTLNIIDMLLLQLKDSDWSTHFSDCSVTECVLIALSEYCFREDERDLIDATGVAEFKFYGNRYLVVHILYNLMRNAFTFIQSEKKGRIAIWTSERANEMNLHFCDTAKGIGKEDLHHVFEHGFSKRSAGSGVGLHYCKKMMETMSGDITVRSQEGKYTEFVLTFPKHKPMSEACSRLPINHKIGEL
jgi:Na+/proline symporter/signal transduction histidine kinase